MTHYICAGTCGGVSDKPGSCQAEECPLKGQELEPCTCEDGRHGNGTPVDDDEEDED